MNDDDMGQYLIADLLSTVDTMLVGRVLYEGFASFWPQVPNQPGTPQALIDFAHWMNNTPKVVFSSTLQTVDWNNSRLAMQDLVTEVKALKAQPGGDMVTFGGAALVQALTEHNLIDEYRIKLEPVVLGQGKPLFKHIPERIRLQLVKAKPFASGVTGLYYQVNRS